MRERKEGRKEGRKERRRRIESCFEEEKNASSQGLAVCLKGVEYRSGFRHFCKDKRERT
jgi:hypothetical protein